MLVGDALLCLGGVYRDLNEVGEVKCRAGAEHSEPDLQLLCLLLSIGCCYVCPLLVSWHSLDRTAEVVPY